MQIEVYADSSLKSSEAFNTKIQEMVESNFSNYDGQVGHIIVHLHDENAAKTGPADKRCRIELRADHLAPLVVTNHADSVMASVEGACEKLSRALETAIAKRRVRAGMPAMDELNA